MGHGFMGMIGLIIGVGVLTGGQTVAPEAHPTLAGGIIVAGGLVLTVLGAWEEYASKRLKMLGKEAAAQFERLAVLREQGRLTEEEFASAKQRILGGDTEEEVPATDDDSELTRLAHLARLKTQGVLTEEEFVMQKQTILLEMGLKTLDRLYVENHLTQLEYQERKEKILEGSTHAYSEAARLDPSQRGRDAL